jgi:hypothetical protein
LYEFNSVNLKHEDLIIIQYYTLKWKIEQNGKLIQLQYIAGNPLTDLKLQQQILSFNNSIH